MENGGRGDKELNKLNEPMPQGGKISVIALKHYR
jgi:hypothetical protein